MRIKNTFIASPVGDSVMLVDIMAPGSKEGLYKLNETAGFIFELIKNQDLDMDQIVDKMLEEYEAPREIIAKDVENTISKFQQLGAIE